MKPFKQKMQSPHMPTTSKQINRLIAFQGDNWDVVNQLWVPSFEANWEYNARLGL
jgi:hypothetical protein